ncbi:MAG: hypothetical protein OXH05_13835 [Acidobacteria bacterium]|nr:hypothetical protein [Acidobacteriota bacterium]
MRFLEDWPPTEQALRREAASLEALLLPFAGRLSPLLIGEAEWRRVWERVGGLPVTLAAFPFGFELPLHEPRPIADLGLSLLGDSVSEEFYTAGARRADADPVTRAIGRLLDETRAEDSALRRVAGRKMMLEYDVPRTPDETAPHPGVFLYPAAGVLIGGAFAERRSDLGVVVDALVAALGWEPDALERREAERVFAALAPGAAIRGVGAFLSRSRAIRLAVTDFRNASELVAFLERADWRGNRGLVASVAGRMGRRHAFGTLGVHLDVRADGLGTNLGLSFFPSAGEWVKDIEPWQALLDGLGEDGLGTPAKLSALKETSCGLEPVLGRAGSYLLLRGIHHVKLVLNPERVEQVKAYVFWLLRHTRPAAAGLGR